MAASILKMLKTWAYLTKTGIKAELLQKHNKIAEKLWRARVAAKIVIALSFHNKPYITCDLELSEYVPNIFHV